MYKQKIILHELDLKLLQSLLTKKLAHWTDLQTWVNVERSHCAHEPNSVIIQNRWLIDHTKYGSSTFSLTCSDAPESPRICNVSAALNKAGRLSCSMLTSPLYTKQRRDSSSVKCTSCRMITGCWQGLLWNHEIAKLN